MRVVFIVKGEKGKSLGTEICTELADGFEFVRVLDYLQPDPASEAKWREHYAEHAGKAFFEGTVAEMTRGPFLVLLCDYRGAADQAFEAADALKRSIRARWAPDPEPKCQNLIHASDSAEAAAREARIWFGIVE